MRLLTAVCTLTISLRKRICSRRLRTSGGARQTFHQSDAAKSFNVYVPRDYTEDRSWPVIFRYEGRGEKYNPIICRGGRMITCDRGAIVVGMGYLNPGTDKIKAAQFIDYIEAELRSIYEAKELISEHLRIDNDRLFVAGRHRSADLLTQSKPGEIDSTEIIRKQIAKQLNKQADHLTKDDLIEIRELSLMGEDVSDSTYVTNLTNLESLDVSFSYIDDVGPLLQCKDLKKLNISGTRVKDVPPLKNLPQLDSLSMWNLWLDRGQTDELGGNLPNLRIIDYQWDLYEKDSIGRVLPKLRVKLN